MQLKNYFLIVLALGLLYFNNLNATSASTAQNGNMSSNSTWNGTPTNADTLYINHDAEWSSTLNWRSSSVNVVIVSSSASVSPDGTNAEWILPSGTKLMLESGGEVINNSGNSSNHAIIVGWTCIWGKKCCSGSTTITGLAQLDTLNVCGYDPLPVELVSFTGNRNGNTVVLNWVTVSETSSSHFIVERSVDGVNFMPVAKVKSVENSNMISEYFISDVLSPDAFSSENLYYRLVQYDLDGASETFNTIHVAGKTLPAKVKILNASSELLININGYSDEYTVIINSIDGKEILNFSGEGSLVRIDTTNMPSGIIVVSINFSGTDYVFSEKFFKN